MVKNIQGDDSLLGGFISVLAFAFNHGEATRVQWTPPLRESFAFPMIIAQITVVTYILKNNCSGASYALLMTMLGGCAMLFWQFSQFAFFTQICSLFVVFTFDFIPRRTMCTLLAGHLAAFVVSFALLFGNEMLLTSLYIASILSAFYCHCLPFLYVVFILNIFVEIAYLQAHIFDILRSKLTNYSTFHTRLYTCSAEFDFIPLETLQKLYDTWLIPSAMLGVLLFAISLLFTERQKMLHRSGERGKQHAELLSSIRIHLDKRIHAVVVFVVIAAMAYEGKSNIEKQLLIKGEYSNPEQEMLFDWIMKETKPDTVFAGTMPVMANVKLTTLRPIVNHPHYEDTGIRDRTKKVYSMFSRKPLNEVHEVLKKMGANYFIFQSIDDIYRPYCAYRGMWDEEDKENLERVSNCDLLHDAVTRNDARRIQPFSIAYSRNNNYVVVKI
ncbi:unnamed protein product [Angiostrongylus costaricensis]|uniref:Sulfatase domain-containing protein n=1 Tax=Angiostrongylus costaricensis TaxID=334426 RepID=A0A0R3Q1A9_ANGCS|nr:unnamed protein product [Angiostrongylus costaricensis]